jgi:hypothetical protein
MDRMNIGTSVAGMVSESHATFALTGSNVTKIASSYTGVYTCSPANITVESLLAACVSRSGMADIPSLVISS